MKLKQINLVMIKSWAAVLMTTAAKGKTRDILAPGEGIEGLRNIAHCDKPQKCIFVMDRTRQWPTSASVISTGEVHTFTVYKFLFLVNVL